MPTRRGRSEMGALQVRLQAVQFGPVGVGHLGSPFTSGSARKDRRRSSKRPPSRSSEGWRARRRPIPRGGSALRGKHPSSSRESSFDDASTGVEAPLLIYFGVNERSLPQRLRLPFSSRQL
jgi:hypothetical protein